MITPIYTAILAIVFITLSLRTIRLRRQLKIGIGTSGNSLMARAIRAHANFTEYVPLTLLMVFMLELQNLHRLFIHALCLALLLGRIIHAYGVSQDNENYRFRMVGMVLTFLSLMGCILAIAVLAIKL